MTEHEVSFLELLSLRTFIRGAGIEGVENLSKLTTEWAENQLLSGNGSDNLLILASLNLESAPDPYEVDDYLARYQRQQGTETPGYKLSALIWMRVQLRLVMAANSPAEIESRLMFFAHCWLEQPSHMTYTIAHRLGHLYWQLYDEDPPVFYSTASRMKDEELCQFIIQHCQPLYRILMNNDWLSLLSGDKY